MNVYRNWPQISASLFLVSALLAPLTVALADAAPSVPHASLPDPPLAQGKLPSPTPQLSPAEQKAIDAQHRIDAALEQLGYLIETGHSQNAIADLIKLKSMPQEKDDPLLQALIAQVALAEKKPDVAWQIIRPWSEHAKLIHPALVRPWLAVGDAYMAKQQYDKVLKHFDWLTAGLSKIDPKIADIPPAQWAEELALSAEGCGMACFYLDRNKDARDSLNFALKVATTRLPHPQDHDKWLIDRISAELAAATPDEDVQNYGEDYVLFRNAERDRRSAHQPAEAFDIYVKVIRKFPKSAFCEPSRLAAALCLLDEGKKDEGEQALQEFAAAKPNGLYTGEALLELARSSLVDQLNPQQATAYFDKLDHWLTAARRGENVPTATEPPNGARSVSKVLPDAAPSADAPTDPLRPATKAITTPPQKMERKDYFGNVSRNPVAIGDLMNQLTCPWYLDDMETQAIILHGFILTTEGKKDEAIALLHKLVALDPEVRTEENAGDPNDFSRLKAGADNGYYMARPQELALYNDRQKFIIMLGDLYYCSQQFEKSEAIFNRMLKGEFGRLTPAQQDYPHYAIATNLYRQPQPGDLSHARALPEYAKAFAHDDGTLTSFRAALAYSNIAFFQRDPKLRAKGLAVVERLAASGADNEYVRDARINLAMWYAQEKKWALAATLLHSVPPSDRFRRAVADDLMKRFAKQMDADEAVKKAAEQNKKAEKENHP